MWYAVFLRGQGRLDEALAQVRRATEVDPLSLANNAVWGGTLYFARRYDQAVEQLRKALDLDSNFALARHWLGMAYEQNKVYDAAAVEFQKATDLLEGEPMGLADLG